MNCVRSVFCALVACFLAAPFTLSAQTSTTGWSIAALDQILANVQPGQKTARIDDMEILVSNLQTWRNRLAGLPQPQLAFDGSAPTWPNGNVYFRSEEHTSELQSPMY